MDWILKTKMKISYFQDTSNLQALYPKGWKGKDMNYLRKIPSCDPFINQPDDVCGEKY